MKEFTKIDGNTTSYSMNGIEANARIRVEQDADLVLKNMKLKLLRQPYLLFNIMTKHTYLPTTLISDKGTAFMSHVIKEVAGILGITLKHASTKHAQTIGLLERSHAPIKEAFKIETGERRSLWHKHINNAVLNYNTSYHTSIDCEPSRLFHCRIPYNVFDLKLGIRPQQQPIPTSQSAQDVLEQTERIHQHVRKNTMQAHIKYKAYYDKKANALILNEAEYVYILQPKADHQGSKIPFTEFRWIGRILSKKYYQTIIF